MLDQVLEKVPGDGGVEGRRLGGIAHPQQQPVALGMEIEGRVEVHRHRHRPRQREGLGDKDVAAVGLDRHADPGHGADHRGVGARAVHNNRGSNILAAGADADDPGGIALNRFDRAVLDDARSQPARRGGVPGGHLVRPGETVGGAEGGGAQIVTAQLGDQLEGLVGAQQPDLFEPGSVLYLDVAGELLGLNVGGGEEEVADLAQRCGGADLLGKAAQHGARHPADADVDLGGELLPHPAGALRGRPLPEGRALEQQRAHAAAGEVVGEAAAHHPAADDQAVGAGGESHRGQRLRGDAVDEDRQRPAVQEGAEHRQLPFHVLLRPAVAGVVDHRQLHLGTAGRQPAQSVHVGDAVGGGGDHQRRLRARRHELHVVPAQPVSQPLAGGAGMGAHLVDEVDLGGMTVDIRSLDQQPLVEVTDHAPAAEPVDSGEHSRRGHHRHLEVEAPAHHLGG